MVMSTGNTRFGQIWPKELKLFIMAEIWYLHKFECAE